MHSKIWTKLPLKHCCDVIIVIIVHYLVYCPVAVQYYRAVSIICVQLSNKLTNTVQYCNIGQVFTTYWTVRTPSDLTAYIYFMYYVSFIPHVAYMY